jgi:hypothetical protein
VHEANDHLEYVFKSRAESVAEPCAYTWGYCSFKLRHLIHLNINTAIGDPVLQNV